MNPILQMLGQGQSRQMKPSNPMQMLQQFAQFKQQMQGRDPRAMVEQLLANGQMTQQQFNQLKQQAQMLQNFLK